LGSGARKKVRGRDVKRGTFLPFPFRERVGVRGGEEEAVPDAR
jgi:hypothetical protein